MIIENIDIDKLHPFEEYPFKVIHDEAMGELMVSIALGGVYTPLSVRPLDNGEFEIISGHRRYEACKMAGIDKVPAIIYEISHDEATIVMVDDNLTQRAKILPSEKAFAYKMKLDAMNHQGKRTDLTFSQLGKKSNGIEEMSKKTGDSKSQIYRYVHLTYLKPEILDMVDQGRIAFGPAVEISYLGLEEQQNLLTTMISEEITPSLSQAQRMRKISEDRHLDADTILNILKEVKGNQVETIKIPAEIVQKHFQRFVSPREMQDFIAKAVEHYCLFLKNRERGNGAR